MLEVGQKAPGFDLPDASMNMVSLEQFRGRKNVVLYFYPKDGTPGCVLQGIDFSELEDEFDRHETVVFGVSLDDCLAHASFRDKHGLTVNLLADSDGEVCRRYGVAEVKNVDGTKKTLINRSTFIIDKQGTLKYVLPAVNPKGHANEVLKLIKKG
jgi:thioredoxin-dependent peroxiredoxin